MNLPFRHFYLLIVVLCLAVSPMLSLGQSSKISAIQAGGYCDSGWVWIDYTNTGCHNTTQTRHVIAQEPGETINEVPAVVSAKPALSKKPILVLHGEISYDFFYRSKDESSINPDDLQQHTERILIRATYRDKYPIRIGVTARQSNSPFYRDNIDFGLSLDKYRYDRNLKAQLLEKIKTQRPGFNYPDYAGYKSQLEIEEQALKKIKNEIEDPRFKQQLIAERERRFLERKKAEKDSITAELYRKISNDSSYAAVPIQKADSLKNPGEATISVRGRLDNKKDSLTGKLTSLKDSVAHTVDSLKQKPGEIKNFISEKKDSLAGKADSIQDKFQSSKDSLENRKDSLLNHFTRYYEQQKKKIDSLEKMLDTTRAKVDALEKKYKRKLNALRDKINESSNSRQLLRLANDNNLDIDSISDRDKLFQSITAFSIGRSTLDYTELTAKDVMITGLNIEANPSWYGAIAAGKVDYRFRDFLTERKVKNRQYVLLGRFGFGNPADKAVIFTYFTGRKSTSAFDYADSVVDYTKVAGYSVAGIYNIGNTVHFSAEYAKSTLPVLSRTTNGKGGAALVNFSDKSNAGVNIKGRVEIRKTNSIFSGFFRQTGENFQCFSLVNYNAQTTAWQARIEQRLLKSKVQIIAMLRKNDFTNPFTTQTYKTSVVFKSLQANFRFKGWPSLSVGYFPTTQYYAVDNQHIYESAYYTINVMSSYNYRLHGLNLSSSVILNRYTSAASDSGMQRFEGTALFCSQTVFLKKFRIQGNYSATRQPNLAFQTFEGGVDLGIRSWMRLSVFEKYNIPEAGGRELGHKLMLTLAIKKIGSLQLMYDKSFLPSYQRNALYPVEMGRINFYKTF